MKYSKVLPTVAVFTLLFVMSANAEESAREWTAEQLSVIDSVRQGPVGIEKDFARWESGYDSDWTYWRMGSDSVRPRDVHMELVRGVIDKGNRIVGFEMDPVDVIVRGEVAQLRYNAKETIVGPNGEESVVAFSAVSFMVRDGEKWVILASSLYYPEH